MMRKVIMNMKTISTQNAPAAIGPYSQAIAAGDFVFTSGQIPLDPATGEVVGTTIQEQAPRTLDNLKAVLEAAGTNMDKVTKTTCFLADMADFAEFNKIYSSYFQNNPARSCFSVKQLPKNVLVEVEAVAYLK